MSEQNTAKEVAAPKEKPKYELKEVLAQMQECQAKILEHTAIAKKYEGMMELCQHMVNTYDWSKKPEIVVQ